MQDSVIIPIVVASINLGFYLFIDPILRKDDFARSLQKSVHDKGTTHAIGIIFPISWLILFVTSALNRFRIGIIEPHQVFAFIGALFMAAGLTTRFVAMKTMGKYFTRTLQLRAPCGLSRYLSLHSSPRIFGRHFNFCRFRVSNRKRYSVNSDCWDARSGLHEENKDRRGNATYHLW